MPLSLYGWRPSWILPKKRVKGVEKFEPYDFLVIWSLMMQYPSLTQFGQTNLANSFFVTSQPPLCGRCWCNLWSIISHIKGRYVEHFQWNCHHVNATRPRWWLVNIDWGNGLVPPGAIVDPDICHQMALLGQNELILWYLQCISNGDTTI